MDDEEQQQGVRCLAVPVVTGTAAVAAASITAPASRLEPGSRVVVAALRSVAADLARSFDGAAI